MLSTANEWKSPNYDPSRRSRTEAVGQISNPELAWVADLRASEYFWCGRLNGGKFHLLPPDDIPPLSLEDQNYWSLRRKKLDVVGNGQLVEPPDAPGARWGKFLPEITGLQRISWTTTWGKDAKFLLHSFETGVEDPNQIWKVEFPGDVYAPLVVVVDLDRDGNLEAVLSTWHGVVVYDIQTGTEKYRCTYRQEHGRQYGFFGAYTDTSGQVYLVPIGDFAGHIGVLTIQEGQLKDLWYHTFDPQSTQGIDRRFTINTVGPNPIGDFNGDGTAEILLNVFNENHDNRWHLIAYDLETGQHKLDLPDIYLQGHFDIDRDGVPELLTQHCPNRCLATNGTIELYRWNQPIWQEANARWSMGPLAELPLERVTGAWRGMEAPITGYLRDGGKPTVFFTTQLANRPDQASDGLSSSGRSSESLHALQANDENEFEVRWQVDASPRVLLSAVAVAEGEVLIRTQSAQQTPIVLNTTDLELEAIGKNYIAQSALQPLVLKNREGHPQLVVAEPLDQISAYQVTGEPEIPLKLSWQTSGRAMTTQTPQMEGLIAADIDQDGIDEVLCVREMPDGHSRLLAIGLDGSSRWHHDFVNFNGRAPTWNECGTTIWTVGHFISPNRLDVMVSNRRSIMHSDETVLINTQIGEVVWHKDLLQMPNHTRGYGGGRCAIFDMDNDGLDDIILGYPAEYSVVDGATGDQIAAVNLGAVEGTTHWVMNGTPMVVNKELVILTHSSMILAFQNQPNQASILWRTEPDDGVNGFPSVRLDGNGNIEIGLPGCIDGFRCIDPKTGEIKWTVMNLDSQVSNCVTTDINHDGIEEFIYGSGTQLKAVARRPDQDSLIVWQIDLPCIIDQVVVADVDGDAMAEILVGGRDGKLYCIKQSI